MSFTDEECDMYTIFWEQNELSDDECACFIVLKGSGMPYLTCEKTILEARRKAVEEAKPEPEPEPEPESVVAE